MAFRHHLVEKTCEVSDDNKTSSKYLNDIVNGHVDTMCDEKVALRNNMNEKRKKLQLSRLIESSDKRCVHFIFDPQCTYYISRYGRDLMALIGGTLEE